MAKNRVILTPGQKSPESGIGREVGPHEIMLRASREFAVIQLVDGFTHLPVQHIKLNLSESWEKLFGITLLLNNKKHPSN